MSTHDSPSPALYLHGNGSRLRRILHLMVPDIRGLTHLLLRSHRTYSVLAVRRYRSCSCGFFFTVVTIKAIKVSLFKLPITSWIHIAPYRLPEVSRYNMSFSLVWQWAMFPVSDLHSKKKYTSLRHSNTNTYSSQAYTEPPSHSSGVRILVLFKSTIGYLPHERGHQYFRPES